MEPGRKLGEFVLREKLGEGAYGIVFRAEQPGLGRDAVVKILHARHFGSETVRKRFVREARVASRLSHPLAAHMYAFGTEDDGTLWLAMELVRGTPLSAWLEQRGPLPLAVFVPLFEQICDVVYGAHEQGIIHRDLKPANIMIVERGGRLSPKLLDFGLARLADGPRERGLEDTDPGADLGITRAGAYIGSPFYMAPEAWARGATIDARSDQYALGITAFECLTGKPPFTGKLVDVGRAHLRDPLPPVGRDLPPAIDAALARATAKDPAARHESVARFASELRAASGLSAPPRGRFLRAAAILAPLAAAGVALAIWRWPRAPRCTGAEARLSGVWDDGVRASMKTAFAGSGLAYAEDSFTGAARRLDEYSRAWVAMHRDACEAAQVRHEQSAALMDLRMTCLSRRLDSLGALTHVMSTAVTPALVEGAVRAADGLEDLAGCADVAALSAAVPPSRDPRVAAVRTELDRANALERAGDLAAALAIARGVQDRAAATGYGPVLAEARFRLADVLLQANQDLPGAEAALKEGLDAAATAHMDHEVALQMTRLMWVLSKLKRADEGLALGVAAETASARAGHPLVIEAALAEARATLLDDKGRLDEAEVQLQRAIELGTRVNGDVTTSMNTLATVYAKRNRFREALALDDEVLRRREQAYGPNHPQVRRILMGRGTNQMRSHHPRDARADYQRAVSIMEHNHDEGQIYAVLLSLVASSYLEAEEYEQSLPALERAAAAAHKLSDPGLLGDVLGNQIQARLVLGDLPGARAALARMMAVRDPSATVSTGFQEHLLAMLALYEKKLPEAETHARRAATLTLQSSDAYMRPIGLETLGWVLLEEGQTEAALAVLEQAHQIRAAGDNLAEALSDLRRAECLAALGRQAEAVPILEHIIAARKEYGLRDPVDDAEPKLVLARALHAAGQDPERVRALAAEAEAQLQTASGRLRVPELLAEARKLR